jgi:membrane-anchored glycerophosphoryl diester phosphodiesterase (GDPDase)
MDFQGYLENSWKMLKKRPLFFILGGLMTQLLTMLSMSLLAGPLMGAYLMTMVLYLRQGRLPEFNDLFAGLPRTRELFSFFFLILLIVLGFMLMVLPGIVFATWWIYTLPLMADRRMRLGEAMRESLRKVTEKGFFIHLIFLLMITLVPILIINVLAAMIPLLLVLKVLLPPIQTACIAGLYLEQFEGLAPSSTVHPARNGAPQSQPLLPEK